MKFCEGSRLTVSLFAVLMTAPIGAARAAGADSAAMPADGGGLQEIVVTAQKRSENLKNIPISISALSSDEIKAKQIVNYDDIARAVPGVSFNSLGASEGLDNISIRGISSTSGSATVGIYLDDVSITVKNFFDGSSEPKLFDVDRIEVLRGPQGTLYGASSMGGTIRFVTKQPNLDDYSGELSSDLSGTVHGGVNYNEGAVLNVPIVPGKAAIRASFGYSLDSGYVDHYTQSGQLAKSGVNNERAMMFRMTGKLLVSDDTTITPGLFFQRDKADDNSAFYPALGLWKQSKQVVEYGRDTMFLPSLTVTHDLGFADVTSVTGYFYREFARQQDGTFYNSTLFAQAFLDPLYPQNAAQNDAIIGNLRSPVKYTTRYGQVTQELRLSSHLPEAGDIPIKWVAGLYYSDQWIHNTNFQQIPGINAAFQQLYGMPIEQSLVNSTFGAPGITQLFPDDVDEADQKKYDERQYAVFGQVDYDILPNLHAAVGARYLMARDVVNFTTYGFYQIGNFSPFNQLSHSYAFTPKFTMTYDVDPSSNVYASASKGYRLGGPEPSPAPFGPTTVCAGDFANLGITSDPLKFASDKLWTYEVGSKNRLDDNKVSIDGSAYYTQWSNIQQQIYLPTCGYYVTLNIGDAEIYGGELEASYRPLPGLTLGLTASYQHASITRTDNASTVAVGQRLIDVPYETYTGSVQYDYPLNGDMTLTARADYTRTGRSNGSYQLGNSDYYNPSYGVLNASVGIETETYDVALYAKNLGDDRTIIQRPQLNTVVEGYTVRPLTVGVTAKVRFNP
ncbi:MAG: TonB-dependent receptor [Rhodospirillales bacterium]|nr:TonB-dependent receptor [Rhodospirillales bacterium]